MLVFAHGYLSSLQAVLRQANKSYWTYPWAFAMQISFQKAVVRAVPCFLMACSGSGCSSDVFGTSLSSLQRLASSSSQKGQLWHSPPHTLLSPRVQLSSPVGKIKAQQSLKEEVVVLPGKEEVKRKGIKHIQLSPVEHCAGSFHSHVQLLDAPCALESSPAFCCFIPVQFCWLLVALLDKTTLLCMVKLGWAKHSVVPEKENHNLSINHPRTCFLGLVLLDYLELEQEKSSDSLISGSPFVSRDVAAAVPLSSNTLALSSVSSAHASTLWLYWKAGGGLWLSNMPGFNSCRTRKRYL